MQKPHILNAVIALAALGLMQIFSASTHAETTSYSGAIALYPNQAGTFSTSTTTYIGNSGTYYLTCDIVYTSTTSGACAIAVLPPSGNVTIDLNGHTISSYAAGQSVSLAVNTYGIGVFNCSNLTVRNGTISGFYYGVYANNPSLPGHRIENMRFTNNTCVAAYVNGIGCTVRNCLVNNTGGTTVSGTNNNCYGIWMAGPSNMVVDCDIAQVSHSASNGSIAAGITFTNTADGVALNNRISQAGVGLNFAGTCTVKYRDNLFGASISSQTSGTSIDAGGNF